MRFRIFYYVVIFAFAPNTNADLVLKDHVSDPALWDGIDVVIGHNYPVADPQLLAVGAASAFIGNGGVLSTVGGIFGMEGPNGVINDGQPGALDFRFAYFGSINDYSADPFLESPQLPNVFARLNSPTNTDWNVQRGTSEGGFELFYWEFDVSHLGIRTTAGSTHLVSITPETNFRSGSTVLALSRGGQSAVGMLADWGTSRSELIAPSTFTDIGLKYDHAAMRITSVPEPRSFSLLCIVAILTSWRHRQSLSQAVWSFCTRSNDASYSTERALRSRRSRQLFGIGSRLIVDQQRTRQLKQRA